MHSPLFSLCIIFTFFLLSSATHRRLLHQPLPPASTPSVNKTKPPFPSPHFHPFFVFLPPPPPPSNDFATFPANISSLFFPRSSHSSKNSTTSKFITILVSVSILSAVFVTALVLFFFLHHRHPHREDKSYDDDHERNDTLRLVSPNTTPSHLEIGRKTSSTLMNGREEIAQSSTATNDFFRLNYQRIGSPELHPLPPLPRRQYFKQHHKIGSFENEDDKFFSPRESSGGRRSPNFIQRSFQYQYMNYYSSNDSLSNSPSGELSVVNFPAQPRFILQPVEHRAMSSSSISSGITNNSPDQNPESTMSKLGNPGRYISIRLPPPPPLPPPRVVEDVGPAMPVLFQSANDISESSEGVERGNEVSMKPKLKPLHWDKVRASSDRAMVWDQLKSSSYKSDLC